MSVNLVIVIVERGTPRVSLGPPKSCSQNNVTGWVGGFKVSETLLALLTTKSNMTSGIHKVK